MNNNIYNDNNNNNNDMLWRQNNLNNNNLDVANNNYYQNYNNSYNYYSNNTNYYSEPPKKKRRYWKVIVPLVIVIVSVTAVVWFAFSDSLKSNKMNRTIMIYMVGSDLESKSKQGTFSISDITENSIDLKNNNVILMVGGAKKWHNFVNANEIGLYELKSDGFEKIDSKQIISMGDPTTLEQFLNYSYENYPAQKYDLIFWNHGLGALGLEQDEVSSDYLSIKELDTAFNNTVFKKDKLEMTIFYNCLASNYHIANIMKKYSQYMVASEEVLYLAKSLNRLSFLESIKEDDTAFNIGYAFIKQSDKVVNEYNNNHLDQIDSTLSILDLSKIDSLNNTLNTFINSINIDDYYYRISNIRRNLHTYGRTQTTDYDTVDLYELVSALGDITNINTNDVLDDINQLVVYTSNMDDYSNGISIYFPYFGSTKAIELHLSAFEKLWNDAYYSFINTFYEIRSGAINGRRAELNKYNELENEIKKEDNNITLELTDEEKESYQSAKAFIFKKIDDKYKLLLETDEVSLENNKLVLENKQLLKVNDNIVSSIKNQNYKVFGILEDSEDKLDTIFSFDNNMIIQTILNSNDYISSSLIEYDDYDDMYVSNIYYKLIDDNEFNEYYRDSKEVENVKIDKDNLNVEIVDNEEEYYILFEMYDMYNDVFYSNLQLMK